MASGDDVLEPTSSNDDMSELRPALTFEQITFSDGQSLSCADDDIVVFVGPNNAGKSACLRELRERVARPISQTVVKSAIVKKVGTGDRLRAYLEKFALKVGDVANVQYAGIEYSVHHSNIQWFDMEDRHPVASFFCNLLATETRITGANQAGAIRLFQDPPSHPIHRLLMDSDLALKINKLFRKAFEQDLLVFRAGGSSFPLLVGQAPIKQDGEDDFTKSYIDKLLASTHQLESQGDGMRSFATVLLHVLSYGNTSIQLLDEPEAFLHPPQARLLGEYIAKERSSRSQLFVSTHSTDIIEGLLAGGSDNVRLIRIQRSGNVNRIKELSKDKLKDITSDTLTKYSGVLSGIFYKHVIIAESDSDCMFYNAILNLKTVSKGRQPDVLFLHASGKHRMEVLASTLRALDVPVSVIADIDILSEQNTFQKLLTALGGDWGQVQNEWTALKTSIEQKRPPLNAEQIKSLINQELQKVQGIGEFPKSAERAVKAIFKSQSPWDQLKNVGRQGLSAGGATNQFDKICSYCASVGLWIVQVGQLEGFCKSIEARHGPSFVENVLDKRDLELDPELSDARNFVEKIWDRAFQVS